MQVDIVVTRYRAHRFVHYHEICPVHEEDGTSVFQILIAWVFRHQYLDIAFRLPEQGLRLRGLQVFIVKRERIVMGGSPEPVSPLHHFGISGIDIGAGILEETAPVVPHFEGTVVRLAVPLTFRSGLYDHLQGIHAPSVAEHEETGSQESFRKIVRQLALRTIRSQVSDELVFREYLRPLRVMAQHGVLPRQLGIAEQRVRIVRETDVRIKDYHFLHSVDIALREIAAESVQVGHGQGLDENLDGSQMIVRVQLELASVIVDLHLDLPVQDIHPALPPYRSLFEFREECPRIDHPLRLEEQVVPLLGVVVQDMVCMPVVVHQKLRQELRGKIRRVYEKLELETLVLQPVAHFQRSPCETHVLGRPLHFPAAHQFILLLVYLHERVLPDPVHILESPLFRVFFVTAHPVGIPHRRKPFVTVELPAQFVVPYRPILPVYILSVIERWLVSVMHIEGVFQGLICPFLLFLADFYLVYVLNLRRFDIAAAIVLQKCRCGSRITPFGVQCLHLLQPGPVQIQQVERLRPQFLGQES